MGVKLRNINAFPHAEDHLTKKTVSGAIVSSIGVLLMLVLFVHEFRFFLSNDVVHQMAVDTTRNERLPIHINITFPALPCQILSVDAIDLSGKHEVDLETNIWKIRLHRSGHIVGSEYVSDLVEKEHSHGNTSHTPEVVTGLLKLINDIKRALKEEEGCRVFGVLDVERVAGNFHISMHGMSVLVAEQVFQSIKDVNVSHIIHSLSFGPTYPGLHNPLDGTRRILHNSAGSFKYFIKVVPTTYIHLSGEVIPTNQFSVGEYFTATKNYDHNWPGEKGICPAFVATCSVSISAAVYFLYDLSPVTVLIKEQRRSFGHFLTRLCAVIGGAFSLTGMLDRWIYRILESLSSSKGGYIGLT